MNYTTLKHLVYATFIPFVALMLNYLKGSPIELILNYGNHSIDDRNKGVLFLIFFFISILLAYNEYRDREEKKRKKNKDLYPYFTKSDVKADTQYYVPTHMQNVAPSIEEEPKVTHAIVLKKKAISFFLDIFENDDHRYYIILAGSGMGKTTLMINLYLSYIDQFRPKHQIKLIPLNNLDGLKEIDETSDEEKSNTILLLDSLDEDPKAVNDYNARLEEVMKKVWRYRKVVITCRTQFFPNEQAEPHQIMIPNPAGGSFYFKKIYLSPFTIKDCKKFLRKRFGIFPFRKKEAALDILSRTQKIMVRPMILSRIEDLLDSDLDYSLLHNIYGQIIEGWIQREGDKQVLPDQEIVKFKDNLRDFSQKVALSIHNNWKTQRVAHLSKIEIKKLAKENEIELENWELTGKSLLNRDASGNWKFAHKSIWEYHIALNAVERLEFRKSIDFNGLDFAELLYNELGIQKFLESFNDHIVNTNGLYLTLIYENIYDAYQGDLMAGLVERELKVFDRIDIGSYGKIVNGLRMSSEELKNKAKVLLSSKGKYFTLFDLMAFIYRRRELESKFNESNISMALNYEVHKKIAWEIIGGKDILNKFSDTEPRMKKIKSMASFGQLDRAKEKENLLINALSKLYEEGERFNSRELKELRSLGYYPIRKQFIRTEKIKENLSKIIENIESLKKIGILNLNFSTTTNLSSLALLPNLKYLSIDRTNINRVEEFNQYTQLEYLSMDYNIINNFSPISNLLNLKYLSLNCSNFSDTSLLRDHLNLQYLSINQTLVKEINDLENLANLRYLSLNYTEIEDISVLMYFNKLEYLSINFTSVYDIKPIFGLKNLKYLSLVYNHFLKIDKKVLEAKLPKCKIIYHEAGNF